MNALGMSRLIAFWEVRRLAALDEAASASRARRPALVHLRESSRCEARVAKLARLADRAAQPRRGVPAPGQVWHMDHSAFDQACLQRGAA